MQDERWANVGSTDVSSPQYRVAIERVFVEFERQKRKGRSLIGCLGSFSRASSRSQGDLKSLFFGCLSGPFFRSVRAATIDAGLKGVFLFLRDRFIHPLHPPRQSFEWPWTKLDLRIPAAPIP